MGNLPEHAGERPCPRRRPRILCLHGFRTSGSIMKTQITGKWPESVTGRLDLVFPDAPFPAAGKSEVEGIFDPPYYEWFQFAKDYKEYINLDAAIARIEDLIVEHGPVDALLGFSQGAMLTAALAGLQRKGLALTRVPRLKFVVIIGGAKFREEMAVKSYSAQIDCPSLHFLGDQDFLKIHGEELKECFKDPTIIRHPKGHTVPRLDEEGLETFHGFLEKIEVLVAQEEEQAGGEVHAPPRSRRPLQNYCEEALAAEA